jgi:tetratricopeptide (TPR) repeat protein
MGAQQAVNRDLRAAPAARPASRFEQARRQVSRYFNLSTVISTAIIAAVAAMVAVANVRDVRRSRTPYTRPDAIGTRGARTTRDDLNRRIASLRQRLDRQPQDVGAAVMLADALMRQTRVTGNAGLAIEAEQALKRSLDGDVANYDANRMLATVYLSQHRFREAIAMAEKTRAARPFDPVNFGIIGDGHLELGEFTEAFDAFDRMMALRPSAASYARVAYARELQGNTAGAVESMKLAADATPADDLEGLAWYQAQLGDLYFQLGKIQEAEAAYISASHAFPGHPFAVLGYARVLAERGEVTSALGLLQELAATAPTADLAARTANLLDRLGRHDEAASQMAIARANGWTGEATRPTLARRVVRR